MSDYVGRHRGGFRVLVEQVEDARDDAHDWYDWAAEPALQTAPQQGRPTYRTGFIVYITDDGSTIINTEAPDTMHQPSADDIRRAAHDVFSLHDTWRVAEAVVARLAR